MCVCNRVRQCLCRVSLFLAHRSVIVNAVVCPVMHHMLCRASVLVGLTHLWRILYQTWEETMVMLLLDLIWWSAQHVLYRADPLATPTPPPLGSNQQRFTSKSCCWHELGRRNGNIDGQGRREKGGKRRWTKSGHVKHFAHTKAHARHMIM